MIKNKEYDVMNDERYTDVIPELSFLEPKDLIKLYIYSHTGNPNNIDYIPEYIFDAVNDILTIIKAIETKSKNDLKNNRKTAVK